MATTISKLYPTGVLQVATNLDETVLQSSSGSASFTASSSTRLSIAANTAFTLNTNNHTVEFWMYQTSRNLYDTVWTYGTGYTINSTNAYYLNCGTQQFQLIIGDGSNFVTTPNLISDPPSLNVWHHYAIVRNSTSLSLYVDGQNKGTINISTRSIPTQPGAMLIGSSGTSPGSINGYVTNFRFVNGTALYTSNFTPPTVQLTAVANTKLLLLQNDNARLLTDSSPNNFTVSNINGVTYNSLTPLYFPMMRVSTTGVYALQFDEINLDSSVAERKKSDGTYQVSGYFDDYTLTVSTIGSTTSTVTPSSNGTVTIGTTNGSPFATTVNSYQITSQPASAPYNYISVPGDSGFAFGTGDFTIEWFQKQTTSTTFSRLFWYGTSPSYGVSEEAGTFYFWSPGFSSFSGLGTILNTWVHFAVVRIGTSLKVYRNGTQIGSTLTNSTNITDTSSRFFIGSKANTGLQSEQFVGSITSFRICKGVGVYTGNFTVPTSPLGQTQGANPYGGSNTTSISAGQCSLLLNP